MGANPNNLILGLDIGVASVGWALVDLRHSNVLNAGVRIFNPAMEPTKFSAGQTGASNNVARRQARLQRRQLRRRSARHRDLYIALQSAGLLPNSGPRAEHRHTVLQSLDLELTQKWRIRMRDAGITDPDQVLCYFLRSNALAGSLEAFEVGRALYHLGQRRGFKSNRKESRAATDAAAATAAKEDTSAIKQGIAGLAQLLATKQETLGQHLASRDPHREPIRNRLRTDLGAIWTGRAMFVEEFERIWAAQTLHHPDLLTSSLKSRLQRLMFDQRGVGPGRPGKCELERDCDRAPKWSAVAQRFRVLQAVNNLTIRSDGQEFRPSDVQRKILIEALETTVGKQGRGEKVHDRFGLTFSEAKQLLQLPRTAKLNLDDEESDSYLRGNRTTAAMVRSFGEKRWLGELSETERRRITRRWARLQDPEKICAIARDEWLLDDAKARQLAETEPEDGYFHLSHKAMLRLLPHLETGLTYAEAIFNEYGNVFAGKEEEDRLGPVVNILPRIPNPAVMRALTEVRKVVNAVVREYGKPAQVRIELARDLKRNADDRRKMQKGMQENRKQRLRAEAEILKESGRAALFHDIDRWRLYQEFSGCIYCGQTAPLARVFDEGAFEVDHIIPRSYTVDNSMNNKALACATCNRLKLNQTPWQAFASNPEQWAELEVRIAKLGKDKQKRFLVQTEEEIQEFTAAHLADTRYITKLAAKYVEQLYGGRDADVPWSDQKRRCVFASSGMATATLRRAWQLNGLIPGGRQEEKFRGDYRHHAIDAITIALTSQATLHAMSTAAATGDGRIEGRLSSRTLQAPWPNFPDSLRPLIDNMKVSHRPEHKLSGEIHAGTNYSPKQPDGSVHTRKPVHLANPEDIVDPAVKKIVEAKIAQLGDRKKLEKNYPVMTSRDGREIPIRRVRVRQPGGKILAVGEGLRQRNVFSGANHHIAIFSGKDRRGHEKWNSPGVVSLQEALCRKQAGEPVVRKEWSDEEGQTWTYIAYLMGDDLVQMDHPAHPPGTIFVVRTISESAQGRLALALVLQNDARLKTEIVKAGPKHFIQTTIDKLREWKARKVEVDVLGRIHYVGGAPEATRAATPE